MDERTADQANRPEAKQLLGIVNQFRGLNSDVPPALTEAVAVVDRRQIVEEFSAFYRDYATRLAAFLISIGVPQSDALDIMQETMHKAYQRWCRIEHPKAWVKATASKAYAERLAKLDPVPVEDIADRLPAVPSGADVADTKHAILTALRQLPMRQRQVLAWSFEGHTPAEIADQLRMTAEAVRSSLYKGRKKLDELLGGDQ
ncbi:sigma-70 family RNA polymerase sigma factor [Micromonospora aurantiaca (nom. illeg.)]|uniref:sigma-70 family RNA polymerase sigma factor n=1 Tax=Micromonospora aurantiaca (nom. illeg.) TaxID=47850 RepID=UPI0001BF174A|nr:sigma-70 family RNA polymerase sigma factor [Micromonospora aurantiaca]ADL47659.1 RNA polymerase sigma factor, sigma-70 family [Micromonospora aurantiaca ATCC 27029]